LRALRPLMLIGVPVLVIAGALIFWLQGGRFATTENAFVKADIAQIASEVPGRIVAVRVRDHAVVAAGDVLVQLDPEPYRLALARAVAEVDSARAAVEQSRSARRPNPKPREPGRSDGRRPSATRARAMFPPPLRLAPERSR